MTYPRPCAWKEGRPGYHSARCWSQECETRGCEAKRAHASREKAKKASYRKFPGRPRQFPDLKRREGTCQWCEGAIMDPKKPGQVNRRRGWHDGRLGEPDCLFQYYVHTRQPEALAFLLNRDGPRCAGCGVIAGRWDGEPRDPAKMRTWGPSWARRYPEAIWAAPYTAVTWSAALQVDHRLALAIVVLTIPEADRWLYWGPMNLQALCHPCHVAKTRQDVIDLKLTRARLDAEARSGEVAPLTDDSTVA